MSSFLFWAGAIGWALVVYFSPELAGRWVRRYHKARGVLTNTIVLKRDEP